MNNISKDFTVEVNYDFFYILSQIIQLIIVSHFIDFNLKQISIKMVIPQIVGHKYIDFNIILIQQTVAQIMERVDKSPRATVISLKPKTRKNSALSLLDQNSIQQQRRPFALNDAFLTESIVVDKYLKCGKMSKENKVNERGKQKIKLTGVSHCKCDLKIQKFEIKQQSLVQSLLRQSNQPYRQNRKAHRISIDLDQLRSQNKENQIKSKLAEQKSVSFVKAKTQKDEYKGSQSIVIQSNVTAYQDKNSNINEKSILRPNQPITSRIPKRKSSSKSIRETLMKKSSNFNKSMDIIERNIYQCYQQLTNTDQCSPSKEFPVKAAAVENLLKELFKKLTKKNLPYEQWINYLNLSYSQLTSEQLRFVGLLLERVEPHYLSSMDYLTFKFKAYQKCRKDLQELITFKQASSQLS